MKGKGQCKCKSSPSFPHYKVSYCYVGCSLLNLTLTAECHMTLQPTVIIPFSEFLLCSWSNLELLTSRLYSNLVLFHPVSPATPVIKSLVCIKFSMYQLHLGKHPPNRGPYTSPSLPSHFCACKRKTWGTVSKWGWWKQRCSRRVFNKGKHVPSAYSEPWLLTARRERQTKLHPQWLERHVPVWALRVGTPRQMALTRSRDRPVNGSSH